MALLNSQPQRLGQRPNSTPCCGCFQGLLGSQQQQQRSGPPAPALAASEDLAPLPAAPLALSTPTFGGETRPVLLPAPGELATGSLPGFGEEEAEVRDDESMSDASQYPDREEDDAVPLGASGALNKSLSQERLRALQAFEARSSAGSVTPNCASERPADEDELDQLFSVDRAAPDAAPEHSHGPRILHRVGGGISMPQLPEMLPEEPGTACGTLLEQLQGALGTREDGQPCWSARTPRPGSMPNTPAQVTPVPMSTPSAPLRPQAIGRTSGLGSPETAGANPQSPPSNNGSPAALDPGADAGAGPAPKAPEPRSRTSGVSTQALILEENGPAQQEASPLADHQQSQLAGLAGALMAPEDGRVVGVWTYGTKDSKFHIRRTQNKLFRFTERFAQGQLVSGVLRQRGPWLQATITFPDGQAVGAIRIRLVEQGNGEVLHCCVKACGEELWSSEITARRRSNSNSPPPAESRTQTGGSSYSGSPPPEPPKRPSFLPAPPQPGGVGWGLLYAAGLFGPLAPSPCCEAQTQLMLSYSFISGSGGGTKRTPEHLSSLRVGLGTEPIVAFIEHRHPVSPPSNSSIWVDHCFAMLEVGMDASWAICVEKLWDGLEVMAGKREAVKAYAAQHRASGQKRPLREGLPIDERPREFIGRQMMLVSDLCDWIEGPLSLQWKAYNATEANGQHLAQELQAFLTRRKPSAPPSLPGKKTGQPEPPMVEASEHQAPGQDGRLNKELMLRAVRRNGSALSHAPETLRSDIEVVRAAVERDPHALQFASPEVRADRSVVLPVVSRTGSALKFAAASLRSDREVVRAAVQQDGEALKYAAQELRADPSIVCAAVLDNVLALGFAERELRHDRRFILQVVKQEGRALQYTSESLRSDRDVVKAAVRQNGLALEWASRDLRADREVVLAAVTQRGTALRFAAHALKADEDLVKMAVDQDWRSLTLAEPSVALSQDVVLTAVQRYWGAFQLAPLELKANREMVLRVVQEDWRTLMFASKELRMDREVTLMAVRRHGMALQMATPEMQSDRAVVLAAVQQDYAALSFAADELKADKEIIMVAVQKHWSTLRQASKELQADREVAAVAVRQSARAFEHVAPCLRSDPGLWLLAERGLAPPSPPPEENRVAAPGESRLSGQSQTESNGPAPGAEEGTVAFEEATEGVADEGPGPSPFSPLVGESREPSAHHPPQTFSGKRLR